MKLNRDFYLRPDVVEISKDLLGKTLNTHINGIITSGLIVEVEAYCGRDDKACHANNNRRTNRTEIMFQNGGAAYVYLCYGIHYLFNVVTNIQGLADAVLVRAVQPIDGVDMMLKRRKMNKVETRITAGPGALSQALGINKTFYGEMLWGNMIWIEDVGEHVKEENIIAVKRVGVDYAGEDAMRPWRFYIKGNEWVSRK